MPEPADVVRFVAWPLVLAIVLLSLTLAVVVRRRYVAAVVRLQQFRCGHGHLPVMVSCV
jgi:hypothetical protein